MPVVTAPVLQQESEAFSATEIAAAIGWSKRRVQRALENFRPIRLNRSGRNLEGAWTVESLPADIRAELERARAVHHCRTISDVLGDPHRAWQLRIGGVLVPLAKVSPAALNAARQLQQAFARALALPEASLMSERVRLAAEDYPKACGTKVSDRHLQRLLARTMERDRRAFRFDRLEIYLEETAAVAQPARPTEMIASEFPELEDALAVLAKPSEATAVETAYCWRRIIETLADRVAAGGNEKKIKLALRTYVVRFAPFLADSPAAFKRNLNRKLRTAGEEGIHTLIDGRGERSGFHRKPSDWDENILLLARHALACGGRAAQAFRDLYYGETRTAEQFSESFRAHFEYDVRQRKSYVPATVMAAVRPMLAAATPHFHGPKAVRLAAPSIQRDWSSMRAGDSYSGDDFTLNHPLFDWCEDGEYEYDGRRFHVTRAQTLLFCDERSRMILGYHVAPRPFYVADDIFTAISRLCMNPAIGLPFARFLFERAIWKSNKVRGLVEWPKLDEALARQGISLKMDHATTPRAKVIERIGGMIQSIMQPAPGYVGRNERLDNLERVQGFLATLKRHGQPLKADRNPAEMLMSKTDFCAELDRSIDLYNREPQGGENMKSRSPGEVWAQESPDRPHIVLPDSLRYLLSTHVSQQTVTREGVKLSLPGGTRFYSDSPRLGEIIGQRVRVRFNPELPDLVTVCHLDSDPRELNPFAVGRGPALPAIGATDEQHAEAKAKRKRFTEYGSTVFRAIAPRHNLTIRNEALGSAESRDRGNRIAALQRDHVEISTKREANRGEIEQLATRQNLRIDAASVRQPDRVAAELRRADELEKEISRMEAQGEEANGSSEDSGESNHAAKTYVLNTVGGPLTKKEIAIYWAAWTRAVKAQPEADRHAITRRVLGCNKAHTALTRAEWRKIVSAFSHIGKGAPKPTTPQP